MPEVTYKNSDFVLLLGDAAPEVMEVVHKYDTFLSTVCRGEYAFQKDAVIQVIKFLFSKRYKQLADLAMENYGQNGRLKQKYPNLAEYLAKFPLKNKKACSLDLATGTGKSFVIYALAQICLAEGLVDKVLVLCPSLTIEEGLKQKFERLAGDHILKQIIEEAGAVHKNPAIKSSNDPILEGDICVENIHATYARTGSSVDDSFRGKGGRVLVINDEAHHIFSPTDNITKKWLDFLGDDDFGFQYIVNLSGTPYIGDEYFHDILYRFSIRDAIDAGVIKKVDYKFEEGLQIDKGFQDSYEYHRKNWEDYGGHVKPISIVVTEKIGSCVRVWKELADFIAAKEKIPPEEAYRKVIWVASGVPAESTKDGKDIRRIITKTPEKVRKENLQLLKSVDERDNPVEWIVSVSMLTEGWDVKNVFQVIPHENRAFNSKLLIAQVLGRGLRIPESLKGKDKPVLLRVNNHERWTSQIENLYRDVLEIENRLSWGYDPVRSKYAFALYNLSYEPVKTTSETKNKPAGDPKTFGFIPQSRSYTNVDKFVESGEYSFEIYTRGLYEIEAAAAYLHGYLKQLENQDIAARWSKKRIKNAIVKELKDKGYDETFLSHENYLKLQQAFGPLMRKLHEENPRMSMKSNELQELQMEEMPLQTFHEGALKKEGMMFYDEGSATWLTGDQKALFESLAEQSANFERASEDMKKYGVDISDLRYLKENIHRIEENNFKTPLGLVYVSHVPECRFIKKLFIHAGAIDSFIKNPDKSFYSFPYSYKPETRAKTKTRQENFNPDFFLKKGDDIIVVEIKKDGDDSKKNAAKYRDGKRHFDELNKALAARDIPQRYWFKFLTPTDYDDFFQVLQEGRYQSWRSELMNMME
ncbi:MAG: DEAD/DEAH box helicase family protein [Syntrophobacterales bacterium]|nr:DEAD/DEAH box helicase family protein [Syntrophobacterales bacterium]